ncbi:MAG: cysteine desulfurase [Actinobacteria bacterium]|nr:cysteine desulfurase [Actinomycetota bacterium]
MAEDIYLDHAATTPLRREVQETLDEILSTTFGNASSIHSFGQDAKRLLEESREVIASCIGANPDEIIFTSGGTESDNLAIRGTALAQKDKGNHIITTTVEHHAVLNCCKALESEGFEVTYVPVNNECLVDPTRIAGAIRPETILVTTMFANNETGAIQPVAEIGELAGKEGVVFHTDAVQAAGKLPVNVEDLQVDLLSLSGHKIYGPKGVGALYVRRGTPLHPLFCGGHHEGAVRPGTENVPGIAAFAKAMEIVIEELPESGTRLRLLKEKLASGLIEIISGVRRNGSKDTDKSLPNILNMSIEGVDGESLLLNLDLMGIAVSTGSACTSGATDPSHVLLAMALPPQLAQSSLRFSFGRDNTEAHVERLLELLPDIVARLRRVSAVRLKDRPGSVQT